MVKMNLAEARTQTADIKSYCASLKEASKNLNIVSSELGLEIGISGTTGDSIKSYISSVYSSLSKAMILLSECIEDANQKYIDEYTSMCGENHLIQKFWRHKLIVIGMSFLV